MENGIGPDSPPPFVYDKKSKGSGGGGDNNSGNDGSSLHGKKSSAKNCDAIDLFFQGGDYTIRIKVLTYAVESTIRANISYSPYENLLEDIKRFFEKVWAVFIGSCAFTINYICMNE